MDHIHHWLIESAHGPTSPGMCRLCGAEKEFLNTVKDNHMGDWSRVSQAKDNRGDGGDNFPNGHHVLDPAPK